MFKGKTHTSETKKRLSSLNQGKTYGSETRLKMSQAHKGKTFSPETKLKMSLAHKGKPRDLAVTEKIILATTGKVRSLQARENIGAAKRGIKHPNWQGGISFEPYCKSFNDQLKDEIRKAFGKKCYLCPHIQQKKKLSIHHIDYNKNSICDGRKWPLIPLCTKCHAKTNFNRWYWFNLLMNYWAINPEINLEKGGEIYV